MICLPHLASLPLFKCLRHHRSFKIECGVRTFAKSQVVHAPMALRDLHHTNSRFVLHRIAHQDGTDLHSEEAGKEEPDGKLSHLLHGPLELLPAGGHDDVKVKDIRGEVVGQADHDDGREDGKAGWKFNGNIY